MLSELIHACTHVDCWCCFSDYGQWLVIDWWLCYWPVEADDHSNQMMTLASQIIAAMPERIKISPSHSKHLLMDEINSRRDRTSSYGSFSSCSSSTPPVCITEDSGISTPLEGMSFLEYRWVCTDQFLLDTRYRFLSFDGVEVWFNNSFIHSGYFYSASSSPPLLWGAPAYSIHTVSKLTRWSTGL